MDVTDIHHIFKAYDIRGKVGTELTTDLLYNLGKAFGKWLPNNGAIAVGRDMRPDSQELSQALIKGLIQCGRDVIDIGEVTSDMIYFAVGNYKLAGGAMVTASHNPGEYNGIKLCREEAKPIGQESGLFEIRDLVIDRPNPEVKKQGEVRLQDIDEAWIMHVLSFIDPSKLKLQAFGVDAGNGMAGKIFPKLEKFVPWKITPLYFELDGTFPNHEANPLKFETLHDLIGIIQAKGLDGGIAFDGDGDRAFLVDETGAVLTGGEMSAMLSEYFLTKHPGSKIVYDARNSRTVPETIKKHGGVPVRERVGHSFLKQAMRQSDAPFGGEASGHFYFRDNWYADSGLIGAVIGIYVATIRGHKLSEIKRYYGNYAAIPETNFKVADKEKTIKRISEVFKDEDQDWLDGLTVNGGAWWFNIRPSNTEPLLRLNAEATSRNALNKLAIRLQSLIKQAN